VTGASTQLRLVEISLDDARWPSFVEASPDATIFHSPAWLRAIAESYGFRGFALGVEDGERLRGLLPMTEVELPLRGRRWVSLPFTDVCPPLLDATVDAAELLDLLERARADAGVSSIEVRASVEGAIVQEPGVQHMLALGRDPEELRRRFRKSVWRMVRQAERNSLRVREATRAEDLLVTYYGLHLATRRRQGVPCQPRRFFDRLWEYVLEPGHGSVFLVERDGTANAGGVFLTGSPTLVYKYGASLPESWPLRPNHLLFWTAMQWGMVQGCERLHFGRSDVGNHGLRSFKSGWGAEERPLLYSAVGAAGHRILPRVPGLPRAVELAIRSSPRFVCRTLGERFYRFAA
jgi:CelD/BcsL family acetyltransferase involved in cellulose biosynthesis